MDPSYKKQRIGAVIDLCALGSVIHKPISKLSKGFRQRVGMAHALLHEPDVLIMDEPTAGLDPNQIVEVRKTLLRIAQEKTILLSTHILQEVEAMAQRVIMINEGRLVYDGSAKGLIERSRLVGQSVSFADRRHRGSGVKRRVGQQAQLVRTETSIDNMFVWCLMLEIWRLDSR